MPGAANFFGKPIGATPGDFTFGEVDGAPISYTPSGIRYYEQYQPPQPVVPYESLSTALDAEGRAIHNRTPKAPSPIRDMMGGIVSGVTQGLTAPGRALRGEPVTYGDAWATALDYGVGSAPTSAPEGALRSGGIKAYHGSPHDFDRFSMDKIGTGEGAQAYGHGLYFAESEDVARSYRDTVGAQHVGKATDWSNPKDVGAYWSHMYGGKDKGIEYLENVLRKQDDMPNAFDANAKEQTQAALDYLKSVDELPTSGHMYEVNINANPDDFLDWDAPLSEQTPKVQDGIERAFGGWPSDRPGGTFYRDLAGARELDPTVGSVGGAADLLRESGIPGIKYKDGMSRGAEGGTRNFVVFDEDLISIVRKYGIAGAAAYLGMPEDEIRNRVGEM